MALSWNRATRCFLCGDPKESAEGLVRAVVDEKNVLLCLRCSRVQKYGGMENNGTNDPIEAGRLR